MKHTQNNTDRQKAMKWWNDELLPFYGHGFKNRESMTKKYFNDRQPTSLTGREIQSIWEKEVTPEPTTPPPAGTEKESTIAGQWKVDYEAAPDVTIWDGEECIATVWAHPKSSEYAKLISSAPELKANNQALKAENTRLRELLGKFCNYHEANATWDKMGNLYYDAKKLTQQ